MQVTIPATIQEAVDQLGSLGQLITARQWERAAIVAAYVQPDLGHGGRDETRSSATLESAVTFAKRGIVGLRSDHTVARYANAWLNERPRPRPGEVVNLDGLPDWPSESSTKVAVQRNTNAVAEAFEDEAFRAKVVERMSPVAREAVTKSAIKADPEVAAEVLAATPSGRLAAQRAIDDAHTAAAVKAQKQHPPMPEPRIAGDHIISLVTEGVRVAIERAAREISGSDLSDANRQALHEGNAANRQRLHDLDVLVDQGHVTDDALYAFMGQEN